MTEIEKLLVDLAAQSVWTDKVTMPIPLYQRVKRVLNALAALDRAAEEKKHPFVFVDSGSENIPDDVLEHKVFPNDGSK